MRYRLRDIPDLIKTPIGRKQLLHGLYIRTTPLFTAAAFLYRLFVVRKTRFIAVVGSFGKTTATRCLLTEFAGRLHERLEYNSGISLAKNILRVRPGEKYAVVEVGISGPGQMKKNAKLVHPDVTVVTSIGSEHNRSLKTLDATRHEKSEMVRVLNNKGLAVLNGDDPNVRWFANRTQARVVTFGIGITNDVRATNIKLDWPNGTMFNLHAKGIVSEVRIRLIGRHMVYPVLAAVASGLHEGLGIDKIISGLERLEPAPGKLQPVVLDNGTVIIRDDMKSSIETIDSAFDLLAEVPAERKFLVLGEVNEPPGGKSPIYRRLGERVAEIFDKAFFICESSGFQAYKAGAVRAGFQRAMLTHFKKHEVLELINTLGKETRKGDVLLVKGRDNQRLARISLALCGRNVRCHIGFCDAKSTWCDTCPMLEEGWEGNRVLI